MVIDSMLTGNAAGVLWVMVKISPLQVLWDRGNEVIDPTGLSDAGGPVDALAALLG